jgi:hypothetical protein
LAAERDTKTPILALIKKPEALRFDATVGAFSSDGLLAVWLLAAYYLALAAQIPAEPKRAVIP